MDAFIADHLRGVSRTYALVIPMLPRGLDEAVGLAYLLFRVVDTLEDAPQIDDTRRRDWLAQTNRLLAELDRGESSSTPSSVLSLPWSATDRVGELNAEQSLFTETGELLRRVGVLPAAYRHPAIVGARRMITGVIHMLERSAARGMRYPAVRDADELREYCYYVAGAVGEMLCSMMSHHLGLASLARLRDIAVELGIGLQLVNILKDARKDARDGRRYLPASADGRGVSTEVYRAVLHEARRSLEKGAEFVLALPATASGLRSFCGLPIAWGAMTLSRAERDASAAKIDRATIASSITRFSELSADDGALGLWLRRLIRGGEPVAG